MRDFTQKVHFLTLSLISGPLVELVGVVGLAIQTVDGIIRVVLDLNETGHLQNKVD